MGFAQMIFSAESMLIMNDSPAVLAGLFQASREIVMGHDVIRVSVGKFC